MYYNTRLTLRGFVLGSAAGFSGFGAAAWGPWALRTVIPCRDRPSMLPFNAGGSLFCATQDRHLLARQESFTHHSRSDDSMGEILKATLQVTAAIKHITDCVKTCSLLFAVLWRVLSVTLIINCWCNVHALYGVCINQRPWLHFIYWASNRCPSHADISPNTDHCKWVPTFFSCYTLILTKKCTTEPEKKSHMQQTKTNSKSKYNVYARYIQSDGFSGSPKHIVLNKSAPKA